MKNRKQLEFVLLRYVPHALRNRYVDFGVLLREIGNESGYVGVQFAPNWREVERLDPRADIPVLEAFEREIAGQVSSFREQDVLVRWLEDGHSNLVQLSPRTVCWAEDPEKEIETLVSLYLSEGPDLGETPKQRESGRRQILTGMQSHFERVGIWELLIHGVRIADFTRSDDSFRFDFGYRLGKALKLFHGVSLQRSVNAAIEVASKFQTLSRTKNENKTFDPMLTVVVDDDLDRHEERVMYTLNAMSADGIQITELREMGTIAEAARSDLQG